MALCQVLEIPLAQPDPSQSGQRTEMKGRGEKVVRNIQELQHQRRDARLLLTAASPDKACQTCITNLGKIFFFLFLSPMLLLNYCLPLDLKVGPVLPVYKDSVLTKDYYSN